MTRVIAYVDGFNLYFGLKEAGFRRFYWLDVISLARNLLKPEQRLISTHYFTARTGYVSIGEDKLKASQLPETLVKLDGFVLSRPASWR